MALSSSEISHIMKVMGGWLSAFRVLRSVRKRIKEAGPMLTVMQDDQNFITDASEQFKKVDRFKRGDAYNRDDVVHLDIDDDPSSGDYDLDWIFVDDQNNETTLSSVTAGTYGDFESLSASDPDGPKGEIKVTSPDNSQNSALRIKLKVHPTAQRMLQDTVGLSEGELDALNSSSQILSNIGANFSETAVEETQSGPLWEDWLIDAFEGDFIPWLADQIGSDADNPLSREIKVGTDGTVSVINSGVLPDLNNELKNASETIQSNTISHDTPSFNGAGDGSVDISLKENAVPGTVTLTCTQGWETSSVNDPERFEASVASSKLGISRKGEREITIFKSWESEELGISNIDITRKTKISGDSESRFSDVELKQINKDNITNKNIEATIDTGNSQIEFRTKDSDSADLTIDIPSDGATKTVEIGTNGVEFTFTYSTGSNDDTVEFTAVPFEVGDTIEFDISNDLASRFNKELLRLYSWSFDQVASSPTIDKKLMIEETEVVSPVVGATN